MSNTEPVPHHWQCAKYGCERRLPRLDATHCDMHDKCSRLGCGARRDALTGLCDPCGEKWRKIKARMKKKFLDGSPCS